MKMQADYTVLFADEHIVVLNKRSGLNIAQDRYDPDSPRLDLIAEKEFGKMFAVHRIDKDTSGAIIYALTQEAHRHLSMQFQNRSVKKMYHCLVRGRPLWNELRVELPLLPDGDAKHRTTVNKKSGKYSLTQFELIGICGPYAWIKAMPETGRTHQIRVHLAENNLSIVCDSLYSANQKGLFLSELKKNWRGDEFAEAPLLSRLALHAYKLEITHPATEKRITFIAPYPKDMDATRKQLAKLYGIDPLKNEE